MAKRISIAAALLFTVMASAAHAVPFSMNVGSTGSSGTPCGSAATAACGNSSLIPNSFGDSADVDFSYRSLSSAGGGQTATSGSGGGVGGALPYYWNGAYSGQPGIWSGLGASSSAIEVRVDANPGFDLTSVTFNLGAWPNVDRSTNWAVYDTSGSTWSLLSSANAVTVSGGTGLAIVLSGLSNVQGVALQFWNDAYNVGLTGVSGNTSVSAVPVPAALPLLVSAIAGAGFVSRRRKAKKAKLAA
jgi:hypothetical protein